MKILRKIKYAILFLALPALGMAANFNYAQKSYIPRLYLSTYGGHDAWTALGQADLLAPVLQSNNSNLFIYGSGRYGYNHPKWEANSWDGSLGLGYRQIVANKAMLGGYVLGSYSETANNHKVMILNPGIEAIGRVWEFRANAYLPIGKSQWSQTGWADEFGNYDYLVLDGHKRRDAKFTYYEEVGTGADTEVGRKLFQVGNFLVKGYVSGYFYNMQHNDNIYGGGARVTLEPTTYLKLSLASSYDNHSHTVIMGGIELSIYDLFFNRNKKVDSNDLSQHLFGKIEHDFGAIATGSSTRTTGGPNDPEVKPVVTDNPADDPNNDSNDDIETPDAWYFGAPVADNGTNARQKGEPGTPQNPYANGEFNTTTIGTIQDYATAHGFQQVSLYFRHGNSFNNFGGHAVIPANFAINGVQDSFKKPAEGANRPLFVGSFSLNSNDTLKNIRFQNNGSQSAALSMTNAQNVILDNIQVGTGKADSSDYATGISMNNSALTVNDSEIYAEQYGTATADNQLNTTGIAMQNSGTLTLNNTAITTNSNATGSFTNIGNSYGIHADGSGATININNSTIQTTAKSSGYNNSYSANAYGLLVGAADQEVAHNHITVSNSEISAFAHESATSTALGSGNGYAILLGYGAITDSNTTNHSIHDNNLTVINNSKLATIGHEAGSGYYGAAGNSYGILVGYGYSNTKNTDQSIYQNSINIADTKITAYAMASGGNFDSANAYGVLLGYGHSDVSDQLDQAIHDNHININNSSINIMAMAGGNDVGSGDAYGVLIGHGHNDIATYWPNRVITGNSLHLKNSSINVNGSAEAISTNSGDSFGVLIGYNNQSLTGGAVSGNTINIENNKFNVSINGAGTNRDIAGVSIGKNASSGSKDNIVTINNNSFNMDLGYNKVVAAYSIVGYNSEDFAKTFKVTNNSFEKTDGSSSSGAKLYYVDPATGKLINLFW